MPNIHSRSPNLCWPHPSGLMRTHTFVCMEQPCCTLRPPAHPSIELFTKRPTRSPASLAASPALQQMHRIHELVGHQGSLSRAGRGAVPHRRLLSFIHSASQPSAAPQTDPPAKRINQLSTTAAAIPEEQLSPVSPVSPEHGTARHAHVNTYLLLPVCLPHTSSFALPSPSAARAALNVLPADTQHTLFGSPLTRSGPLATLKGAPEDAAAAGATAGWSAAAADARWSGSWKGGSLCCMSGTSGSGWG
mmetsp:Transcript_21132/g.60391  ORF Transcript_21132/g.60391 Transcript_21132/m.60391 type:complete len:248 (-) Transcript_21132:900-1643(-)